MKEAISLNFDNDIIGEILEQFPHPELIKKRKSSPAADHLFKVRAKGKLLDEERKSTFHTTVAQCLFLCPRSRADIQTAVAF